jgi:hypothetical protein
MNNDFPRMVYKAGGPHEIHGSQFDYLIAEDAEELDAMLADGWKLTTDEARTPAEKPVDDVLDTAADTAPPTRAELEAKAAELGIEFSPRIGDAKLAERIDAALAKA